MELVNKPAIDQLEAMIKGLPSMKKERALEVACGSCHVTDKLLKRYFAQIELMDQAQNAIDEAEILQQKCKRVTRVYKATM